METKIAVDNLLIPKLFGNFDENVLFIEKELAVRVMAGDGYVKISGQAADVGRTEILTIKLIDLLHKNAQLDKLTIINTLKLADEGKLDEIDRLADSVIAYTAKGKEIKCKTPGQKYYVDCIKKNTVVFGIGPAGTGKTYLAVALAVMSYKAGEVEKIILTRPAIEAGEKLGFLPGDLQMKVDPYLRPLYDALGDLFGADGYTKLIERGVIEIAPLAYMRGRTLSGAFIILDEAQNTSSEQMKMFLTRLGEGSKMVITGDKTQIDLPLGKNSGLIEAEKVLTEIPGIQLCYLTDKDIVRHELIQRIVLAYDKFQKRTTDKRKEEEKD